MSLALTSLNSDLRHCLHFRFQWLSIPFAMTHEAVSSISENNSRWLGQWNINKTGQWLDYAFLLVTIGHGSVREGF